METPRPKSGFLQRDVVSCIMTAALVIGTWGLVMVQHFIEESGPRIFPATPPSPLHAPPVRYPSAGSNPQGLRMSEIGDLPKKTAIRASILEIIRSICRRFGPPVNTKC